jgi:hypothetical protein
MLVNLAQCELTYLVSAALAAAVAGGSWPYLVHTTLAKLCRTLK